MPSRARVTDEDEDAPLFHSAPPPPSTKGTRGKSSRSSRSPAADLASIRSKQSQPSSKHVSFSSLEHASATPKFVGPAYDVEMADAGGRPAALPTEEPNKEQQSFTAPGRHERSVQTTFVRQFWKIVMYVICVGPWKFIRGLSWVINRWQRCCKTLSVASYQTSDFMDKHMPTVLSTLTWMGSVTSLALHFVSVGLTFAVIKMLYDNGHKGYAIVMALLYLASHYLMAVIVYFEMDRVKNSGRYTAHDVFEFLCRLLQVLFWDIQMLASLIHSNFMIDGLTQIILKGYEEARVCLHALVNTIPACIMIGMVYDIKTLRVDLQSLDLTSSYRDRLATALAFSILNAIEKWIRFTLADPWMHPKFDDGYPLVYMRSNAARIPHGLILSWLFRCNNQLQETNGELRLKELFSVYTFNLKGRTKQLCDGHKAYLVKKVFRSFNEAGGRYNKAEALARRLQALDRSKFKHTETIMSLNANGINPGPEMCSMLGEVFSGTNSFYSLLLAKNGMSDLAVAVVLDGLKHNDNVQLEHLDLSENELGQKGCEAVAQYVAFCSQLHTLNLSGNPVTDGGARVLAEALVRSGTVNRIDLSSTSISADSGATLGALLRNNTSIKALNVSGTGLGSAGVDQLCKGLKANTSLQELDLSKTDTDDKACISLAQAIISNRTLKQLNLAHTAIGDAGAKVLCDALQQNGNITRLDLTGAAIDKSWIKLINNIISTKSAKPGAG